MYQKIELKVEHYSEESYDCDCCGACFPEGINIYYNNELVWKKYHDGHMDGYQIPEDETIIQTVVNKLLEDGSNAIKTESTESCRALWNKNHPGNGIARTEQSWQEYHNQNLEYFKESCQEILTKCDGSSAIPYKEINQVKLVALWINESTGIDVTVIS